MSELVPRPTLRVGDQLEIGSYHLQLARDLGILAAGVRYFEVAVLSQVNSESDGERPSEDPESEVRIGLLRVGSPDSNLSRELQLRDEIGDYGMFAPILARAEIEFSPECEQLPLPDDDRPPTEPSESDREPEVADQETEAEGSPAEVLETSDRPSPEAELSLDSESEAAPPPADVTDTAGDSSAGEPDYLEEEYYEEISLETASDRALLVLSPYPDPERTLANWWQVERSCEECLSLAVQVCQCFSYLERHQWLFIDLLPQFVEIGKPQFVEIGKPLQIYDLTSVYPTSGSLDRGVVGDYCAPELASNPEVRASASSYTVGAILYRALHQHPPQMSESGEIAIRPLPQIHQLLEICLSPVPQERFGLAELVGLLVQTRKAIRQQRVQWAIASQTTVGLSPYRLTNEDNYGAKQQQTSDGQTLLLGVVADGMGGLAQGEVASQIAVQTVLHSSLPETASSPETQQAWLRDLFQTANAAIARELHEGGTTLSVVFACGSRLSVAHVGDSRIYLLRDGELQQLSEDHSLVAMLVASGQITPEESITHPERNILTKSLGTKPHLSDGYVQDLEQTTGELTLTLQNDDIILLCSDGLWDLVREPELQACFSPPHTLRSGVKQAIEQAIAGGASDNATLLALQCWIDRDL